MRGKKALLSFIFTLFLVLPAANIDWIKCMENSGPAAADFPADLTEGEITNSNDGKYRDGVVDNFDYFVNPEYPSRFFPLLEIQGVDRYALQNNPEKMRKKQNKAIMLRE